MENSESELSKRLSALQAMDSVYKGLIAFLSRFSNWRS